MALEYPITVDDIEFEQEDTLLQNCIMRGKCGDMVSVRPCGEEYENKTFLGIMLGDMALSLGCSFKKETGTLIIRKAMHNPAMFIPDLNIVVYGCGSWWSLIKSADQLKKITDADIDNVWYVKALKQLETAETADAT